MLSWFESVFSNHCWIHHHGIFCIEAESFKIPPSTLFMCCDNKLKEWILHMNTLRITHIIQRYITADTFNYVWIICWSAYLPVWHEGSGQASVLDNVFPATFSCLLLYKTILQGSAALYERGVSEMGINDAREKHWISCDETRTWTSILISSVPISAVPWVVSSSGPAS